jgi:hypothetical protein
MNKPRSNEKSRIERLFQRYSIVNLELGSSQEATKTFPKDAGATLASASFQQLSGVASI